MRGTVIPAVAQLVAATFGAGTMIGAAAQPAIATEEPWWFVAIVVPLAGVVALMLRWMMQRQDQILSQQAAREDLVRKEQKEREDRREVREDARAQQTELQTQAMQGCLIELRSLGRQHEQMLQSLDELRRKP